MKKLSLISTVAAVGALAVIAACSNQAKAKPVFTIKDAPKAGVVAKIGAEEITEDQLVGNDQLDFFELKKREYELKLERLNRLVEEKLVGAEAKKASLSTEEFINKKVVGGETKITDKEIDKFVAEKKIPKDQLNPQIKERIQNYLTAQKRQEKIAAYVAKLVKSSPVEQYFSKPKMEVQVEVGKSPTMGKDSAPVTIVEFSDFQCPFCSRAAETVNEIKKKYGNKVRVAFKHFPLPMHREAGPTSEMAMCVHEQNPDKFWKFHDLAFKNQDKLDEANLIKFAKDAGVDGKKAEECLKAGKFKQMVSEDMAYGEKIGVRSTPTFFINGQLVAGALPIESFSEIIDEAISDSKK